MGIIWVSSLKFVATDYVRLIFGFYHHILSTLQNCLKIQEALNEHFAITDDQMQEFANKCRQKFPYALKFLSGALGKNDNETENSNDDSKAINDLKEPSMDQQITVA
jgi:hypothetical protein